jgi:hypothetical protein
MVQPQNGSYFTLEELQYFVGGRIQQVPFPDGTSLICNDEGKLDDLPINGQATDVWITHYGFTDIIVGTALVCSPEEMGE